MIKHATASAFLLHRDTAGWKTGLVLHPIFGKWMMPGGHVEDDENPEETVLREITEETGLTSVRLINPTGGIAMPPQPTAHPIRVPSWIVEHPVERDNHLAEPHIHVDHKYLAIVDDSESDATPAHPFAWYRYEELDETAILDDVRAALDVVFALAQRLRSDQPA